MGAEERMGQVGTTRLTDGTLLVTEKVTTIISHRSNEPPRSEVGTIILDTPVWIQVQKTEVLSERVVPPSAHGQEAK